MWARDGSELYYVSSRGSLMAIPIRTGSSFTYGSAASIIDMPFTNDPVERSGRSYDVSPDGDRFLMLEDANDSATSEIVVVLNWFEELKRLVPTDN